jgi:hypothetical protein
MLFTGVAFVRPRKQQTGTLELPSQSFQYRAHDRSGECLRTQNDRSVYEHPYDDHLILKALTVGTPGQINLHRLEYLHSGWYYHK